MKSDTLVLVRLYVAGIIIFLISATAISLYYNIRQTLELHEELVRDRARSYFQIIQTTRSWNAEHGGVYVPVTEKFLPNPYLEDPLRDITTKTGMKLTKINPAYMTRLIGEILQGKGLYVHITSLKPINPSNRPDEWETKALSGFEKGTKEVFTSIEEAKSGLFRYMAPLVVETPCLKCHAKQGYKAGDIRGGISVSFQSALFFKQISRAKKQLYIIHILFFMLGLAIALMMGKRLIISISESQARQDRIKKLEGILPVCASCKKIRDDKGHWTQIEAYIRDHSEAEFSHGICPECAREIYKDFYKEE